MTRTDAGHHDALARKAPHHRPDGTVVRVHGIAAAVGVDAGGLHVALSTFTKVFVTVLVIMDPLASVSVFLSLASDDTPHRQHEAAAQASLLAGAVIFAFALFGQGIHVKTRRTPCPAGGSSVFSAVSSV